MDEKTRRKFELDSQDIASALKIDGRMVDAWLMGAAKLPAEIAKREAFAFEALHQTVGRNNGTGRDRARSGTGNNRAARVPYSGFQAAA